MWDSAAGARMRIIHCIASLGSRLLSIASILYRIDVPKSIKRGRRLQVTSYIPAYVEHEC